MENLIVANWLFRNLEGWWCTCNVSGIWQPLVEAICCRGTRDSGNLCLYTSCMFLAKKHTHIYIYSVSWLICQTISHQGFLCDPLLICQDQEIDDEMEFLILASDGLWDVVPNEVSYYLLNYLFRGAGIPLFTRSTRVE